MPGRPRSGPSPRAGGIGDGPAFQLVDLGPRRGGLPVVCLDARHAKAALSLQVNKTDANKAGRISNCRDGLLRSYLFEAANVLLVRHPKPSKLRTWGLGLAARIGIRPAKVAVARKLAVIMHRVWKDDRDFDWGDAMASA